MSSPRFLNDGPADIIQIQQALNKQSLELNDQLEEIREEQRIIKDQLSKLNKNIEKLVDVLNQSNPRAKNLMIRSYGTHKVVSNFIKEPKNDNFK
jgi:uncharacterized phage infection (PIP) family protein YhgE